MIAILCAGAGYRWHDYLGVRKHLLRLDGETIVGRTVRQLSELGAPDVTVVAPDDPGYRLPGAALFTPERTIITDTSVDKVLASAPLWNATGPTSLLWGDVWWSDEAIRSVVDYTADEWHVWYRRAASAITGKTNGEFFALVFPPADHARLVQCCDRVVALYRSGEIPWKDTGAWSIYRAMLGDVPVHGWHDGRHATLVDDWTDDFDHPRDYRAWYGRRAAGRYPLDAVDVLGSLEGIAADQQAAAVATVVELGLPVIPYDVPPDRPPQCALIPKSSPMTLADLPADTTRLDGGR